MDEFFRTKRTFVFRLFKMHRTPSGLKLTDPFDREMVGYRASEVLDKMREAVMRLNEKRQPDEPELVIASMRIIKDAP